MDKTRGFKHLKGKSVKDIEMSSSGGVRFLLADGTVLALGLQPVSHGSQHILLKEKQKLEKFPRPKKNMAMWPYPPEKQTKAKKHANKPNPTPPSRPRLGSDEDPYAELGPFDTSGKV